MFYIVKFTSPAAQEFFSSILSFYTVSLIVVDSGQISTFFHFVLHCSQWRI